MNFAQNIGAALLLSLLLAACGAQRPDYAVEGARRELAVKAANNFVAALNQGACQAIYDGASEVFRQLESVEEWVRECAQMRSRLGSWRGTSIWSVTVGGAGVTMLRGSIQFDHGTYRLQMDYLEEGGHARLFLLELDGEKSGFIAPRPRVPPDQRRLDTPGRFAPGPA